VALFAIKYLRSLGYQASNDLFAAKSWYFRNALVRANYENVRLQIEKTQLSLEEFFKVLLFGCEIELKNRYLRVGCEYGSRHAVDKGPS
ncbi:MAG: cell filamentation protein Fic, partial [Kiritimatiellae bacterium]|nr:cell filamentation protein Fic [Kiritimatiellia bacterium]